MDIKVFDLSNDVFDPPVPKIISTNEKKKYNYSEKLRRPMDIEFHLMNNDSRRCINEGQIVKFITSGEDYECKKEDISDSYYQYTLLLEKLRIFIRKLIKTDDFGNKYGIKDSANWDIKAPYDSTNADLFISVTMRPCEGSTAAYATFLTYDSTNFRPVQGLINICPASFITEWTKRQETDLFQTLFHELVHTMGLHNKWFSYWLNRETGDNWGSSFPLTQFIDNRYPKKRFNILHTPQSKKYAMKRWNASEFAPGIPMGIELEDGGGSGTEMSHPEGRISVGEVMSGQGTGTSVISDMVLSIIEDMGWYSVDFSLAKPLKWADFRSFGEKQPKDLHREPMLKFLPSDFYCSDDDLKTVVGCDYDYQSITACMNEPVTCPGSTIEEQDYCSTTGFYNPLNLSYKGSVYQDYIPIKHSIGRIDETFCFKCQSNDPDYPNVLVANVECAENKTQYNVDLFGRTYLCDYEGKYHSILNNPIYSYFLCSSPKYLCEMNDYDRRTIPQPEKVPFPLDILPSSTIKPSITNQPGSKKQSNPNILTMVLMGGGLIIIVVGIVVFKLIKKKDEYEQSSNFHQF